jgi:hypothetical protein
MLITDNISIIICAILQRVRKEFPKIEKKEL